MKVVILCGGEGTRMKEETEFKPKPLVEVGGKPVLWHIMKIYSHYGFNEFILTLGYKGNMIKDYFLQEQAHSKDFTLSTKDQKIIYHNDSNDDFVITFVDTGLKSLTGERLRRVKNYIDGEDFMLTYGDGVADIDINQLVAFHKKQGTIGTLTGVQPSIKYGIIQRDDATGKMQSFKQNLVGENKQYVNQHDFMINGGFMVFKKPFIDQIKPDTMVEEAFLPLTDQGQMSIYHHKGQWKAMDTYKEVEEMNGYWKNDPFWKVWGQPGSAAAPSINNSAREVSLHPLGSFVPSSSQRPAAVNPAQVNSLRGKNVLVTGGTGLVGSHVVERLLDAGANVFVLDIVLKPKSYFAHKNLSAKAKVIMQDVRDLAKIKEIVKNYEVEYILHLAARVLVTDAILEPHLTLDTNIMGTVNVLEAARASDKILGVVVASSDKAYGKNSVNVKEDQPLAGDHPYDVSKSATDLIARTYFQTYGLPVVVSRFGNIFGPGDLNFDRLVPGIMQKLINNKPLELRSDGSFVRDYVYVKDVADGYLVLTEQVHKFKGHAFNLSSGHNYSVIDLINKFSQVLGRPIEYTILNNQQNEIPAQSLNWDKAKEVLGWEPKNSLEQGIIETYNWYSELLK